MKGKRGYKKRAAKKVNPKLKHEIHREIIKEMKKEVELKHFETSIGYQNTAVTIPNTLNLFLMQMSQGLTDSNRIGDRICLKGLQYRFSLYNNKDNTPGDCPIQTVWRILFVQDKSYNVSTTGPGGSAQITTTQLLINDPNIASAGIDSLRNVDHYNTLTVLSDKTYTTNQANHPVQHIEGFVPLKYANKKIQYSAASNLTMITNGIFLIVVTSYGPFGPTADAPQFTGQTRILYEDA